MRRAITLLVALGLATLAAPVPPATSAPSCDVRVSAPSDVQARLNQAGPGKTVCFSGTFTTRTGEWKPLAGQRLVGGTFRYTGSYNITRDRAAGGKLADAFYLHSTPNVTLSGMTIQNFEGRAVVCGPGSQIIDSRMTGNRQNAIGCIANHGDWHIVIRGNVMTNNSSKALEFQTAGAVKLMELSKPGHCLTCGALIENNVASNNVGNGIWLDRTSSGATIQNNTANDNTHKGIRCEKCAGPILIVGNTARGNNHEQISLANSAVVTMRNNVTNGAGQGALRVIYAGVARKSYPSIGDDSLGYHAKSIVIQDTRLLDGKLNGCGYKNVRCTR